jgi:dolichol-phosphate mannosyltransferase
MGESVMSELDIVIPVYNEGAGIAPVLESLASSVKTPFRTYICYDRDDDTTLPYLKPFMDKGMAITPLKNKGVGAQGAVLTGFRTSTAPWVIMLPADDTVNARILDQMVEEARKGAEIVCASRFMEGGKMEGCPWLKAVLVRTASFTLYHLARLPTHDATNGFRLFSRRVLDTITIESSTGFTYSLELLVKVHLLGWKIAEVPAEWYERTQGRSRFKVLSWVPSYLKWYFYAFKRKAS